MADVVKENDAPFRWSKARNEAAQLLAEDELTDDEICAKVDIGRATIWRWKKHPEFAARIKELTEQLGDVALRYAIGRRARRVSALNDRWERMKAVIAARAEAEEMADAAGGDTGVLAHTMKSIGAGPNAEKVDEYAFDAALLKELREHEKQAAQELGQWVDKNALTNPDGTEPYQSFSDEQIILRILGILGPAALAESLSGPAGSKAGGVETTGPE